MSFIDKSNKLEFNKNQVGPESSGKHRGCFIRFICCNSGKDKKDKFAADFKLTLFFENYCPKSRDQNPCDGFTALDDLCDRCR